MKRTLQRILYVEDEQDIQEVAKFALEAVGGFTVKICSSGQEAIEAAAGFEPDLILLDVMMPGMDGPSTFEKWQKIPGVESVPVIFMTAKVLPQEVAHYKDLGVLDVIPKPFEPMTLSDAINRIWRKFSD
ncbi:MAG: response regulator [bacterium]|nr:response regulator [bacterium]